MGENLAVLITGGIGVVTTIVSGWTSWFFARKKYNSEVDSQVIANMKESLDFYKNLSDDNKERLTQVLEQNREILEQNAQLLEQNAKLEKEVSTLKEQIETLTARLQKTEDEVKEVEKTKKTKNGTRSKKDI